MVASNESVKMQMVMNTGNGMGPTLRSSALMGVSDDMLAVQCVVDCKVFNDLGEETRRQNSVAIGGVVHSESYVCVSAQGTEHPSFGNNVGEELRPSWSYEHMELREMTMLGCLGKCRAEP